MNSEIVITTLTRSDFDNVISLGNLVHGEGYLDTQMLQVMLTKSIKDGVNASFVAYQGEQLIGFRLTYAPGQWQIDRWCSPDLWGVPAYQCCYFKCNTVAKQARGKGIGKALLQRAIAACRLQGATAGVSHLWQQSPDNSAVGYFTQAGGQLVKEHPNRWNNNPDHPDYVCVLCGANCHCTACEMIIKW